MPFRTLEEQKRFAKYQRVRLRMRKHERDPRPESFRLDEDSLKLLGLVQPGRQWVDRWDWIKPTMSRSMCEIQALQEASGKSLGAFRPKMVTGFVIHDGTKEWTGRQRAALDQLWLFERQSKPLEKIPYVFKYQYVCHASDCPGHEQSVLDWELMALYRNVRRTARNPDEIKSRIRDKYLADLCASNRDTVFFVGNHSQHPTSFMVLGVFWPPKQPQQSLFS